MRVAIMQPYFFPYIGYFQLLASVDLFVIYDNIKYTKKGWINRNRLLRAGKDVMFSLPLKGDSDHLDIRDRALAADFDPEKLLNQFRGAYRRAPHFDDTLALVEQVVRHPERNLFRFLHHALLKTRDHLGIPTEVRVSSDVDCDHGLKNADRVMAICRAVGATTYVNPIGGVDLYSREFFQNRGVDLKFLESRPHEYEQFGEPFVAWLSIIDVLMFNPLPTVRTRLLPHHELA
ncbi:MAG: WbqC family protein [Burkholderiaceae bacterium]|nr:WbqC family protein [Burkholderiaceae bacterium]